MQDALENVCKLQQVRNTAVCALSKSRYNDLRSTALASSLFPVLN